MNRSGRPDEVEQAEAQAAKHAEFPSVSIDMIYTVNCSTCGFSEAFGDAEDAEDAAAEHNESNCGEVITTGSFVFRASQQNGDYVDCQHCGRTLNDDTMGIVTNHDGFAFCSEACILADHDEGETLHYFYSDGDSGPYCAECGDTAEGLMHSNTERNVEPLLYNGEE